MIGTSHLTRPCSGRSEQRPPHSMEWSPRAARIRLGAPPNKALQRTRQSHSAELHRWADKENWHVKA